MVIISSGCMALCGVMGWLGSITHQESSRDLLCWSCSSLCLLWSPSLGCSLSVSGNLSTESNLKGVGVAASEELVRGCWRGILLLGIASLAATRSLSPCWSTFPTCLWASQQSWLTPQPGRPGMLWNRSRWRESLWKLMPPTSCPDR